MAGVKVMLTLCEEDVLLVSVVVNVVHLLEAIVNDFSPNVTLPETDRVNVVASVP